jgi:hypothetical protein
MSINLLLADPNQAVIWRGPLIRAYPKNLV